MADAISAAPDKEASRPLRVERTGNVELSLERGVARLAPPRKQWPLLLAADTLSVLLSFLLASAVHKAIVTPGHAMTEGVRRDLLFLPLYLLALAAYGLYRRSGRRLHATSFPDLSPLVHALGVGAIASLAVSALASDQFGTSKAGWEEVALISLSAVFLVPLGRAALGICLRRSPTYAPRVVIVGSGLVAASLARRLQRSAGVQVLGFVDDEPHAPNGLPCRYLGSIRDLPQACEETGADRVVVAFSKSSPASVIDILRKLGPGIRISVVPRLFELLTWHSQVEEVSGLTLMDVAPPQLGPFDLALKRALDIAVSSLLLLAQLPLFASIAIAIKATSKGPVLFRQDRTGRGGRVFQMFKFRTMEEGADKAKIDLRERNEVEWPLFKLRDDPRVTKVGRFLRKTSLDELPQLVNVFLGQMSLVGPRPFVPEESARLDGWAARRFDVRPGMTGLWQISGRNDLPAEELRQLDYAYVASWSLWWDLKILWHTPGSVFRRHGAY
jgi:exopolysaccharide biosynthesis polyprenyl glycosylphosphotransferase